MDGEIFQYMVDFTLPAVLSERFTARIPEQRAMVNKYFSEGKLATYGVALETGKCWAVFKADSEAEVREWVRALPLARFCQYKIHPMTFYNVITPQVPNFSIN